MKDRTLKMNSVILTTLCLWVLCGVIINISASKLGEEPLFKEVRDRVRYVKDDGVDKIVDENKKTSGIVQREASIIAISRDGNKKNEEKTDGVNVSNDSSEKDIEIPKLNDTKEESIKSTIDYSKVHDEKPNNKGLPVFITDDGKTIQLPHSDVLYNSKTGEILIRNREHHESAAVEAHTENAHDIFNVQKHDSDNIKNLKGFVLDDANENKKVLYPVTVPSVETNIEDVVNQTSESTTTISILTKNDSVVIENSTDVVEITTTSNAPPVITDLQQSENKRVLLDPTNGDNISNNLALEMKIDQKTEAAFTTDVIIPLHKIVKSAMGRSNEKEFDAQKLQSEELTTEFPENEPVYKFPINETEGGIINHQTEEEEHKSSKFVEYDPNLFQKQKVATLEETEITPVEDEAQLYSVVAKNPTSTVSEEKSNDVLDKNNIVKGKMMNIDKIDRNIEEDNKEHTYVFSTTTEKLEPMDALRNYLEDVFLRGPIAILVDVEPRNLIRTRELWTAMESKTGNLNIEDVVLFGYDIDGITTMSYHKGNRQMGANEGDAKSLTKTLYGITSTSKYYSGPGNPRMALTKAIQLLPYDSAIFIFEADRSDGNSNGESSSAPVPGKLIKQLITKRIKIYCISSGQAWASGAAVTSGGSNIYLDASAHYTTQSPLSPLSNQNLQNHALYQAQANAPHYREMRALSVYYDMDEDDELVYDEQQILLLVHNTTGTVPILIPLDSGIKVLTVNITKKPKMSILRGPHGIEIDLLDSSSISNFSVKSKELTSKDEDSVRVALVLAKRNDEEKLADEEEEEMVGGESSEYHGTWKLYLQSDQSVDVQVRAETNLRIMAKISKADSGAGNRKFVSSLKIAVGGSVASIKDAEVVDVYGNTLGKLSYSRSRDDSGESDAVEIESVRALESGTVVKQMKIPEDLHPGDLFRVRVEGRNDKDEPFVRISSILTTPDDHQLTGIDGSVELLNTNSSFTENGKTANIQMSNADVGVDHIDGGRAFNGSLNEHQQVISSTTLETQPLTLIQIGASSRLYGAPGTILQVHFEVTNRRENSVFFRFGARDDKYFLRSLSPQTQWINAGQTTNVVLTVGITSTAENNIKDTITFTANGLEPASLSLYVYVETDGRISSDRARPTLRHEFIGECMGYLGDDNCRQRTWGLDIIARDTDSGVMRISASPGLVYYQGNFYAGGLEEARARFTSTCCTKQVIVAATDVAGNMASYEVNVAQYFTPASIAAIALGVILFIILIIVIVLLIRLCIKRRKTSRDLPSYSTQRG